MANGYAYVTLWLGGVQAVDLADPAHPTVVGSYRTAGFAPHVAVAGQHAYLTVPANPRDRVAATLQVLGVADPRQLTEAGRLTVSGIMGPQAVAVLGRYVYIAPAPGGLWVVDVADPTSPTHVGTYRVEAVDP